MIPLHLAGIALAGRTLLSKYDNSSQKQGKPLVRLHPRTKPLTISTLLESTPLNTVFRSITSTISELTKKPVREDYNAIVKSFTTSDVQLLKPQYPPNSKTIDFVDIDGDLQKELITSYRHNEGVKTLVLKKENDSWRKISEINNSGYNIINFRGTANITGNSNKQLLIGLASKGKAPDLYGYSFEDGNFNELFMHKYNRFDFIRQEKTRDKASNVQLAMWNKKDTNSYDIKLLGWNGYELDEIENNSDYYFSNVVPYYVHKVKSMPNNPLNWYNLADTLVKSGTHRDALIAIDVGMSQDRDSQYKERFNALRDELKKK